MDYQPLYPLYLKDGDVLKEEHIKHIEDGIVNNEERIKKGAYIPLDSVSVCGDFLIADENFGEPLTLIEYSYTAEGESEDTYCRYIGRAQDRDGYVIGFRFLDASHLRVVTVWFETFQSQQELEFTPLTGIESILLDDESTANDVTNAINAYRTYGTNVLFTTNGADFGTLVAIKERPQKVLYFVTTELSGDKPSVLAVTVGTDGIMTVSRMEIVNRENIVHTVLTETEMDRIIGNATEDDIGNSYLFCGATTDKYTHGVIYIIGEEDVNG